MRWRPGSRTPSSRSRRTSIPTTSASCRGSPNPRSWSWHDANGSNRNAIAVSWGVTGRENLGQRNTPLVTEECEGQVTVTDPGHPLCGRVLKLVGLASLPGHIRYCQVEILPDHYGYVPVSCTD